MEVETIKSRSDRGNSSQATVEMAVSNFLALENALTHGSSSSETLLQDGSFLSLENAFTNMSIKTVDYEDYENTPDIEVITPLS
jgi:hypothetical protein